MGWVLRPGLLVFALLFSTRWLSAHSSEFIGAKLESGPGRVLKLEITADYGENPMITSIEEARTAISTNLEVQTSSGYVPITQMAPLTLTEHSEPDRSSPLPTDPTDKAHKLLRGTWTWEAPPELKSVRFRVPDDVIHSTIFWLNDETVPKEERKWSMLLGGDSTPEIPLPEATPLRHVAVFGVIFVALATFLWVLRT